MSKTPENPVDKSDKWNAPEAHELYNKLTALHLKWLRANPDGRAPIVSLEALLSIVEQVLALETCVSCRRGLAIYAVQALTEMIFAIEAADEESGEAPAHGEHVH